MKRKNQQKSKLKLRYLWIFLAVMVLFGFGIYSQANSVAVIINEKGTHKTVESAFEECNDKRTYYRAQGQDCEECKLTCPSDVTRQSNGLYSFSYLEGSAIYEGTYTNLECDTIGEEVGRLLEVKSFCNDNIRVCEKQDGVGTVVKQESVENGVARLLSYRVWDMNCETGKIIGQSVATVKWQLVCDDDFYPNGNKLTKYRNNLGYCEPAYTKQGDDVLSGKITEIRFDSRAATTEEVTIRGNFKADNDGKYYVYGTIEKKSTAFSVISKFGMEDLCGDDLHTAGVFYDLNKGDDALFELSIPAPNEPGEYDVHVGVRDGCYRDDMAKKDSTIVITEKESLLDKVIQEVITEDPSALELVKGDIKDKLAIIESLESCNGNEDFTVEGCTIAECIDGEVFLISEDEIEAMCDQEVSETIDIAKREYSEELPFLSKVFDASKPEGRIFWGIVAFVVVSGVAVFIFKKNKG